MIRSIFVSVVLAALLTWSISADAQGRNPSGGAGAGNRPSMGQQQDMRSMRQQSELRRQESEIRRQATETRRQEAELRKAEAENKRIAAEENNRSEESRTEHPPNGHAADEAFLAEENAESQNLRDERPDLRGDNRGDHGAETDNDDQI